MHKQWRLYVQFSHAARYTKEAQYNPMCSRRNDALHKNEVNKIYYHHNMHQCSIDGMCVCFFLPCTYTNLHK